MSGPRGGQRGARRAQPARTASDDDADREAALASSAASDSSAVVVERRDSEDEEVELAVTSAGGHQDEPPQRNGHQPSGAVVGEQEGWLKRTSDRVGRALLRAFKVVACLAAAAAPTGVLIVLARRSGTDEAFWGQAIAATALASVTLILFATGPRRYTTREAIGPQPKKGDAIPDGSYAQDTVLSRAQYKGLDSDGKRKVSRQRGLLFRSMYIGADGRWSTSKLQVLLWTYAIAYGLLAIFVGDQLGLDMLDTRTGDEPKAAREDESGGGDGYEFGQLEFREEYLLLLGGPFVAALSAKAITQNKVDEGVVDKTPPAKEAKGAAGVAEVISDDDGRTDVVDFQYFLFNLIALAVFLVLFVPSVQSGLPEIPGFLVALTGASATAYIGKKAVERSAPTLSSVVPTRVLPGGQVTIEGQHLLGAGDRLPTVTVDGRLVADDSFEILRRPQRSTDLARLRLRVPDEVGPGADKELAVHAGAFAAATVMIEIIAGPDVTAVAPDPLPLVASGIVTVTGTGFGPAGANVRLELADVPLEVVDWKPEKIVATLPPTPPPLPSGDGPALTLTVTRHDGVHAGHPAKVSLPAVSVADVTPSPIALRPGARVVITGAGFGTTGAVPRVRLGASELEVEPGRLDALMVCTLPADVAEVAGGVPGPQAARVSVDRAGWAPGAKDVTVQTPGA